MPLPWKWDNIEELVSDTPYFLPTHSCHVCLYLAHSHLCQHLTPRCRPLHPDMFSVPPQHAANHFSDLESNTGTLGKWLQAFQSFFSSSSIKSLYMSKSHHGAQYQCCPAGPGIWDSSCCCWDIWGQRCHSLQWMLCISVPVQHHADMSCCLTEVLWAGKTWEGRICFKHHSDV